MFLAPTLGIGLTGTERATDGGNSPLLATICLPWHHSLPDGCRHILAQVHSGPQSSTSCMVQSCTPRLVPPPSWAHPSSPSWLLAPSSKQIPWLPCCVSWMVPSSCPSWMADL